jgi:uncharacterized protein
MTSPTTHLLYLHGFRSSPQSMKAQKVAARMQARHPKVVWWCPQLPPSPREAMDMVVRGVQDWPRETMGVVGSSLGGFYARGLALQTGCRRTVLLNPAVFPARDLVKYIGEQTAWHDPTERFFFRPEFVDELRALSVPVLSRPERTLAIIAQGDELLDWREMRDRYVGATLHVIEGSDHALSDFDAHLPRLLDHLGLDGQAA